mgnify:CR=1 FL=1
MKVRVKISNNEEYMYSGHDASKVSSLNKGDIVYCKNDAENTIKYKYLDTKTDTITLSVI